MNENKCWQEATTNSVEDYDETPIFNEVRNVNQL